jgi:hypothetical protein
MTLIQNSHCPSQESQPSLLLILAMLLVASLAPFVLLATEVVANPVVIRESGSSGVSVPISKKFSNNSTTDVVKSDQARLMSFRNQSDRSALFSTPSVSLSDNVFSFIATVGIGNANPATNCESFQFPPSIVSYMPVLDKLVLDTASAITWVGANQTYKVTQSSASTPDSVVSTALSTDS